MVIVLTWNGEWNGMNACMVVHSYVSYTPRSLRILLTVVHRGSNRETWQFYTIRGGLRRSSGNRGKVQRLRLPVLISTGVWVHDETSARALALHLLFIIIYIYKKLDSSRPFNRIYIKDTCNI